jgi:thioredoxin-related protein
MRKLMIALSCLFLVQMATAQSESEWLTSYDAAVTKAKAENKQILMSFSGSDWCGNCQRLDQELFQQAAFAEYAKENLVLLQLDFPAKKKNLLPAEQTAHNEQLAEQYNKKGVFPRVLILTTDGTVQGAMAHPANSAAAYLSSLKSIKAK